ncbi:hypothetical protein LHJ74_06065 [Streptomyces sp. N2-109]|uniref:Uncharacterized protein n=1 Tax=Streptomyces gossypii TaxID=2883101 RepID=A0ABT2JQ47_9ACTN|nr:hypothetical protein [Streptomyces gossypii]MCT2589495.1 hypothetical protein [Streptomyces gossypii]
MPLPERTYTRREKAQRAKLLFQGAKRCAGDISRIEKQIERIDQAAEDRARLEIQAHARLLETAKHDVANARVAERCARGDEKATARQQRKDAEKRLRAVERARR